MASRCGEPIEVLSARSEWSTLYARPDGTRELVTSVSAVRTKAHGAWETIDSSLTPTQTGLTVTSPVLPMTFSDGSADLPLARISRDGHELTLDVPFALPAPSVVGSQLTYQDVLPGVDLIVTVNADTTGFSEVLRIASPEAAADPRLQEIRLPIETSADLTVKSAQGGFEARDATGAPVFWSPAPQMWDSRRQLTPTGAGTPRRAVGSWLSVDPSGLQQAMSDTEQSRVRSVAPLGGERAAVMTEAVTDDAVTVVPDTALLTDAATVWPVYVDPAVSGSLNSWMSARSTGATTWMFPSDDGVGLCRSDAYMTCSPSQFASRLRWRFAGLDQIGALDAADITGATFSVFGTHSYNCTERPVTLYMTPDFDASSDWQSTFGWSGLSSQSVSHKASCGNQRWIGFDATAGARAVASGNGGVLALGLGTDESSNVNWKRYRYDATLSITFNRAPNGAANVRTSAPAAPCVMGDGRPYVNSLTPTLAADISDPDGGNVSGVLQLYRTADAAPVWPWVVSAAQASGSTWRATVPGGMLTDGTGYSWGIHAQDDAGRAGPSTWCEFVVDITPPNMPGVSPGPGSPYQEGTRAGGPHIPGSFTFTNGGSSDVDHYQYGFNDSAMTSRAGPGTTVPFDPAKAGPQVLYVTSVDRAGNVSSRRGFAFSVDVPATSAMWLFDEAATSTTAVNTVAGGPTLSVSSASLRVPGVMAELDPGSAVPGDGALRFASLSDQVVSAAPVVATDRSYSVGAFVKLDDLAGVQTAVSQNGVNAPGFELGYRSGTGSGCPTAAGCWAFTTYGSDATSPATTVVASSRTVPTGEWVYLMGQYDAQSHVAGLYVCDPGGAPDAELTSPFTAAWYATSGLAVGRGKAGGSPANGLHGTVDDVTVLAGVADVDVVRRYCAAAATP
ncbi:LamG-like jellyroll fold domain-containing protein [Cellulomonas citrea]|uniref:LamG-like jellyroll fold domain-containing protein n=1 Tax=Cellulomonas citrea TaxID=1909423 RepID=UPI001356D6C9|nr:LamG-like jellyroll fold domain-containing protein [Cellulomonas citrea]